MIKKCNVISNNTYRNIIVFEFDGKPIQCTYKLGDNEKFVYVSYINSKYGIVSQDDYDKYLKESDDSTHDKIAVKKTKSRNIVVNKGNG